MAVTRAQEFFVGIHNIRDGKSPISRHIEQAKARTLELPHKYIQSSSIILLLLLLERSRGYSAEYSRSKEHSLFRNYPE